MGFYKVLGGSGSGTVYVASASPPTNKKSLWIDLENNNVMKFNDGTEWIPLTAFGGGFIASSTTPEDISMLWIDTSNNNMIKYHNGTEWVTTSSNAIWG